MWRYTAVLTVMLLDVAHAAETKLTGPEITQLLRERSLYAEGVEQIFRASGQTIYIDGGNPSQGTWKVDADQYCSQWPPSETWACYDVTQDGEVITFISRSGTRYPMRGTK